MMDTSYLTTQVTTIISQLHSIFDEIGVPRNEREARETEVPRYPTPCGNQTLTAVSCSQHYQRHSIINYAW
jgi:hypothetical protein